MSAETLKFISFLHLLRRGGRILLNGQISMHAFDRTSAQQRAASVRQSHSGLGSGEEWRGEGAASRRECLLVPASVLSRCDIHCATAQFESCPTPNPEHIRSDLQSTQLLGIRRRPTHGFGEKAGGQNLLLFIYTFDSHAQSMQDTHPLGFVPQVPVSRQEFILCLSVGCLRSFSWLVTSTSVDDSGELCVRQCPIGLPACTVTCSRSAGEACSQGNMGILGHGLRCAK